MSKRNSIDDATPEQWDSLFDNYYGDRGITPCEPPIDGRVRPGYRTGHGIGFKPRENPNKQEPITKGMLDYFPNACRAVANCSYVGNQQHNPGQELHWAKEKSTDHADALVRHLLKRNTVDTDGVRHSAKVAWRALALLETEIEREV